MPWKNGTDIEWHKHDCVQESLVAAVYSRSILVMSLGGAMFLERRAYLARICVGLWARRGLSADVAGCPSRGLVALALQLAVFSLCPAADRARSGKRPGSSCGRRSSTAATVVVSPRRAPGRPARSTACSRRVRRPSPSQHPRASGRSKAHLRTKRGLMRRLHLGVRVTFIWLVVC